MLHHLMQRAIHFQGGAKGLAEALDWDADEILLIAEGRGAISPYRAGQLAELLGVDPAATVIAAHAASAQSSSERAWWEALSRSHPLERPCLRELVAREFGGKYDTVLPSAMERAGIRFPAEARPAATRGVRFFDLWPSYFAPNSQVPISARREVMAWHLLGDPRAEEAVGSWSATRSAVSAPAPQQPKG